jgi:hypothetical protein
MKPDCQRLVRYLNRQVESPRWRRGEDVALYQELYRQIKTCRSKECAFSGHGIAGSIVDDGHGKLRLVVNRLGLDAEGKRVSIDLERTTSALLDGAVGLMRDRPQFRELEIKAVRVTDRRLRGSLRDVGFRRGWRLDKWELGSALATGTLFYVNTQAQAFPNLMGIVLGGFTVKSFLVLGQGSGDYTVTIPREAIENLNPMDP